VAVVPIPFAPLLGFVLGVVLAWVSRDGIARDDGPLIASRFVAIPAAFALAVYAPIAGYFVAFHADWSYLYLWPSERVPSAVDLALVLLAGASVPVGALISAPAARHRRLGTVAWLASVPAVLAAALFAWSARRLAVSATYAQFHGDFGTVPISASSLGRGVLVMAIVGALGVIWSVRMLDSGRGGGVR
jgi:hypothetical protein